MVMPENMTRIIIDTSLITSLLVFALRVVAKEVKAVLGDFLQIIEFIVRWWIFIRSTMKVTSLASSPVAAD